MQYLQRREYMLPSDCNNYSYGNVITTRIRFLFHSTHLKEKTQVCASLMSSLLFQFAAKHGKALHG